MKQSLRRPWYVRCVNTRLTLCLIFWSTQETTLIVATRGAISFNLQQNWVPGRNVPFLIPTARRMIAVRSAHARGTKGAKQGGGCCATRDSLGKELQTCVIRVFILSKDSVVAVTIKSAYEDFGARFSSATKEEQQNIVSPSVAAWLGLVRTTLSAPTHREQVQAGFRVHRDGTSMSELMEGLKLVKTRKAWDKNTVQVALVCRSQPPFSIYLPLCVR